MYFQGVTTSDLIRLPFGSKDFYTDTSATLDPRLPEHLPVSAHYHRDQTTRLPFILCSEHLAVRGESKLIPKVHSRLTAPDKSQMWFVHLHISMFKPKSASCSIHIRNITQNYRRGDLQSALHQLGFSTCVLYWEDTDATATCPYHSGWCLVEFLDAEAAERARSIVDGHDFNGRKLQVDSCDLDEVGQKILEPSAQSIAQNGSQLHADHMLEQRQHYQRRKINLCHGSSQNNVCSDLSVRTVFARIP